MGSTVGGRGLKSPQRSYKKKTKEAERFAS